MLVSVLLGLATIMVWVRSYYVVDLVSLTRDGHGADGSRWRIEYSGWAENGRLAVQRDRFWFPAEMYAHGWRTGAWQVSNNSNTWSVDHINPHKWSPGNSSLANRLGFGIETEVHSSIIDGNTLQHVLWCPSWFLFMLTAILPTVHLLRWCRCRHRLEASRCPTCGYDLRATPTGCPECGFERVP